MRVSRYAQSADLTYLVQMPVDHVLADAVPPIDHLSRVDPEREPVPGPGGDLLAENHQQVVTGEWTPDAMGVGCVVLGDGDEVKPGLTGTGRELLRRQLATVRA